MRTKRARFSLIDCDPNTVILDDMLDALTHIPRFTGHSRISILEHQIRAYLIAWHDLDIREPKLLKTILNHDSHEAYVADVSSPMKVLMRLMSEDGQTSDYDRIEARVGQAVAEALDLFWPHPDEVKEADLLALAAEMDITWGTGTATESGLVLPSSGYFIGMSPINMRLEFMSIFKKLTAEQEVMYG
ncbi:hypothetical protein KC887_02415 [Candidatus Kaiserbacteria bacterium]|nr:hypothetical protein [Candidatus Kaiserbacteria bacterium]